MYLLLKVPKGGTASIKQEKVNSNMKKQTKTLKKHYVSDMAAYGFMLRKKYK